MNPLVSIIIPAYNAANTLSKCMDSICMQTYRPIEIIVVNDGSTDKTWEICEKYSRCKEYIKSINIANNGVSNARNIGVANASGLYIQFVDSDDTIDPNMTEMLVNEGLQTQADCVVCGYEVLHIHKSYEVLPPEEYTKHTVSQSQILESILDADINGLYNSPCNKLYKTNIIRNNNILYPKHLSLGEDFLFNLEYFSRCKNVSFLSIAPYKYNHIIDSSLSNKVRKDIFEVHEELFHYYCQFYKNTGSFHLYEERIMEYYLRNVKYMILSTGAMHANFNCKDKMTLYDTIANSDNFKKCIGFIHPKDKTTALIFRLIRKRHLFLLQGFVYIRSVIARLWRIVRRENKRARRSEH